MARLYVMNRGPKPKRLMQKAALSVLTLVVVGGSGVLARQYFQAETKIGPTPAATVTKVLAAETSVKSFDAGPISLSLPKDWEAFHAPDTINSAYSWRNTAKNKGVQVLTAYIDAMPPAPVALNRVLPVEAAEGRIQQLSDVSDNCTDFAEGGRNVAAGKVTVRWSGVQFLCDTGNYNRDVVGIASAGSVNGVKLNSPSGLHHIFLTYTDAEISPHHNIFTDAVASLRIH